MRTTIGNHRLMAAGAVAWALVALGATARGASQSQGSTYDGRVVGFSSNTLVMTGSDGQYHAHPLPADAKLTIDGKSCKAADLTSGMRIRVTARGRNNSAAVQIEGINKNSKFAGARQEGIVVRLAGNKLVMTGVQGKEQFACTLAADVNVTCDGKAARSSDLKPGMRIRVIMDSEDPHAATRIEALDKDMDFASNPHDGIVVGIAGNKLTMADAPGKEEYACTLTAKAEVTCDGKNCKSSDLKPGMRIRVTTDDEDPHAAIRIEAIEKNVEFAGP